MSVDPGIIIQAVGAAVTVGAVYGTVKTSLNGTKERVKESVAFIKEVNTKLDTHITSDESVQRQLLMGMARMETKIDERTVPSPPKSLS